MAEADEHRMRADAGSEATHPTNSEGEATSRSAIDSMRFVLLLTLGLRFTLSAAAALAYTTLPPLMPADVIQRLSLGIEPVAGPLAGPLLDAWQRWDTLWYLLVATRGYAPHDTSVFAPPLYPLLTRVAGDVLGGQYLLGGLAVSNVAYVLALWLFYRLTAWELDEAVARRSVLYLAVFPTAFFFLAGYSESLFLLFSLAAFYAARRGRWGLAGAAGLLAGVARLQGFILVVPLAVEYMRQRGLSRRLLSWDLLGLAAVPLGMLAFMAYVYAVVGTDSPLAPFLVHSQRIHGSLTWPGQALWDGVWVIVTGRFFYADVLDLVAVLLFVGLTIVALRRLPLAYGVYMAVSLCVILSKTGFPQPLESASRLALPLFPGFMVLGLWGRNPWVHRLIVYPSLLLLFILTAIFAAWGWVA